MKTINKKIIAVFCVLMMGVFTFSSCEKDFLDVNDNPNNPSDAAVELVLPTAMGYAAFAFNTQYHVMGGYWSQYWTQGASASQWQDVDRYEVDATETDRAWQQLYSGPLSDFKYIMEQTQNTERKNYAAIAKIMSAYIYQNLTDMYDDIPFTEALKGDEGIIAPKYDKQETVYDGLITMIDEGIALIDMDTDIHPGSDDLIFNGDMHEWLKFANSLKLRVYMRQSERRPDVAQTGIAAMYAANAEFMGSGDVAQINFVDELNNSNPYYQLNVGLGVNYNVLASKTSIDFLQNTNDPRIDVFYMEGVVAGTPTHQGLAQGAGEQFVGAFNPNEYSWPGGAIGGPDGGADAPVVFFSGAESLFLQAEAAARGWGTGSAKTLYEDGIKESFRQHGLLGVDADSFILQLNLPFASLQDQIEAIITQKWVALNGSNHIEAWSEFRRTGYPDFLTISLSSRVGNNFPARILYPSSEQTRNPNTPSDKQTQITKVWWDAN